VSTSMVLKHLVLTGPEVPTARLDFTQGCNLVWGASNTGKSFTLKALNFMMGGSDQLPIIDERRGYSSILFGFTLSGQGDFTVQRAIDGGDYTLFTGLVTNSSEGENPQTLAAQHDAHSDDNLSNLLLRHLGLDGKVIAKNAHGVKANLSFRHLAHLLLVDEASMQAERSPVERGQREDRTLERGVFRFLLSGEDDSDIVSLPDPKKVLAERRTRVDVLTELIAELDERIAREYSGSADYESDLRVVDNILGDLQRVLALGHQDITDLLREKQFLASEIPAVGTRIDEIKLHQSRFAQLDEVYGSDIARLQALEEAGFLVALTEDRDCPLCGADPQHQQHLHVSEHAQQIRSAAIAEIAKIAAMRTDLERTVGELRAEQSQLQLRAPVITARLAAIDHELNDLLPSIQQRRQELEEFLEERDHAQTALSLRAQRDALLAKRELATKRSANKLGKPNLRLPEHLAREFSKVVGDVLAEWKFPGDNVVTFDDKKFDVVIDGKNRVYNGKGVRAVTHAAFQVALLIFCRERNLPHPGFVVLDTPLLTYRDPIKVSRHGPLASDEIALAQTPLKQRFFEHLHTIRNLGQFIVLENVDLPTNILDLAHLESFTGPGGGGRAGLLG
jgi:hypothetical protein